MTISEIKQLIANDEHCTLELKKSTSELVKGMQTLCAFLNTDGGWLIFGVTPKLEVLELNHCGCSIYDRIPGKLGYRS